MKNPNIPKYLFTAATVFSLAMPLGGLIQLFENHFSGTPQNPSKTVSQSVLAGFFIAACCTGFIIYKDEQRKKQAEKCLPHYFRVLGSFPEGVDKFWAVLNSNQLSSEQTITVKKAISTLFVEETSTNPDLGSSRSNKSVLSAKGLMDNISQKYGSGPDAIDAFLGALRDAMGENYPPVLSKSHEWSKLIASFLNPYRFNFIESPNPPLGSYDPKTLRITLPASGVDLATLVHELTHALKQDPDIQPQGAPYLKFMRKWLCEEIVAESSCYYGYDGAKQILDEISSPPMRLEYDLIVEGIKQDDRETLIAAAAYAVLSKNCFKNEVWLRDSTTYVWLRDYTTYYNRENNTNHSVDQTFEPPLLPPTLARAVKEILENNASIAETWHEKTGITPETLALAAEQTQWPMFESDIVSQQTMGLLAESGQGF